MQCSNRWATGTLQPVMAEISSPLDCLDFGPSEHRGLTRLHRSSEAVVQPKALQSGSSPGLSDVTCRGDDGRIDSRLGRSVWGNANFGAVVRTAEPVAHKPFGAGSSVLSCKGFSAAAGTAACTDSHQQHVCNFLYKPPGRYSLQTCLYEQAADLLLWADRIFLSIRAALIPSLLNRGADMLSRKGFPKESGGCTPSRFGWIWPALGEQRWICSPQARMRTVRCSSLYPTPRWKGTLWHCTGQQPGCMRSLWSRYCHWCYTRSGRRELWWHSSPQTGRTSLGSRTWQSCWWHRPGRSPSGGTYYLRWMARCGTRTRSCGAFMYGCFGDIRGAELGDCILRIHLQSRHGTVRWC